MKNRLVWLDRARGVAILAIVASHTGYLPLSAVLSPLLGAFMVPLFLISGGYSFSKVVSLRSLISKKRNSLMRPYIIAVLLGFPLWMALSTGFGHNAIAKPYREVITSALTGGSVIFNGSIWFLPPYFLSSVLLGVALVFWKGKRVRFIITAVLVPLILFFLIRIPSEVMPLSVDLSLLFLGYMSLGHLLKSKGGEVWKGVYFILSAVLFLIGSTVSGESDIRIKVLSDPFVYLLSSLSGCYFVLYFSRLPVWNNNLPGKILEFCGRYSLLILLTNWPVMQIMTYLLGLSGVPDRLHAVPTSTNLYLYSDGPSLSLTLFRFSVFSAYFLIPVFAVWIAVRIRRYISTERI